MRSVVLAKIIFLFLFSFAYAEQNSLEKLMQSIRNDYSSISHITADELSKQLADQENIVLFDVREKKEYEISHLKDAIRVDPDVWTNSFLQTYSDRIKGKTVIFYCSVGVRSSRLASRVKSGLENAGAKVIHNLEGGIFQWHGKQFYLVNKNGQTDFVHPYNSYWGRLVRRREMLRDTIK